MANDGIGTILELSAERPRECVEHECVEHVITLLDGLIGELGQDHAAKCTILQAASLLRKQIGPQAAGATAAATAGGGGRLLAWQARKVRQYVDAHIAGPIRVADLAALIQRSEAHFSRSFKDTLGVSPHAFVVQRRVEIAAQYMLETDTFLSDIALRCGFADQAHLSKQFRLATGQTPAAWRRARRTQDMGNIAPTGRLRPATRTQSPQHGRLPERGYGWRA